jgi:hypothetical protein
VRVTKKRCLGGVLKKELCLVYRSASVAKSFSLPISRMNKRVWRTVDSAYCSLLLLMAGKREVGCLQQKKFAGLRCCLDWLLASMLCCAAGKLRSLPAALCLAICSFFCCWFGWLMAESISLLTFICPTRSPVVEGEGEGRVRRNGTRTRCGMGGTSKDALGPDYSSFSIVENMKQTRSKSSPARLSNHRPENLPRH